MSFVPLGPPLNALAVDSRRKTSRAVGPASGLAATATEPKRARRSCGDGEALAAPIATGDRGGRVNGSDTLMGCYEPSRVFPRSPELL